MPAVPWCILVICCTCANNAFLCSFKYQNGGLWWWHAWAHPFRAREQKELEFKGLGIKIARWKRPGVWKRSASVNSAIKMVTIFSSAGIFKSEENLGIIGHWVTTAVSIFFFFFFKFWILVSSETTIVSVSKKKKYTGFVNLPPPFMSDSMEYAAQGEGVGQAFTSELPALWFSDMKTKLLFIQRNCSCFWWRVPLLIRIKNNLWLIHVASWPS